MLSPSPVVVTDRRLVPVGELLPRLTAILDAAEGRAWVQVREKDLEGGALLELARAIVAVARPRGAAVLVNDRLDVALAAGTDGVHLPENGIDVTTARRVAAACGRSIVVGCSRHDAAGVAAAAADGADLIVLGPIWSTPSKQAMGAPLGPAVLTQARAAIGAAHLVAIGGIETAARAAEARRAGAHAVAAIRALWTAGDPAAAARALVEAGG
jgi:thiamine-phosphate pyrophosphorylase